jgi:hypothetical protein
VGGFATVAGVAPAALAADARRAKKGKARADPEQDRADIIEETEERGRARERPANQQQQQQQPACDPNAGNFAPRRA